MNTLPGPTFRDLDRAEIDALLARHHVGRLAYAFRDRVDIRPIHYVYQDGWIVGRASDGSAIETIRHNYWVAFEVDEVDDLFNWRSVIVHGGCYLLAPTGAADERRAWNDAIDALRGILPETFTDRDPVAFRTTIFRIAVQEASGRAASWRRES